MKLINVDLRRGELVDVLIALNKQIDEFKHVLAFAHTLSASGRQAIEHDVDVYTNRVELLSAKLKQFDCLHNNKTSQTTFMGGSEYSVTTTCVDCGKVWHED